MHHKLHFVDYEWIIFADKGNISDTNPCFSIQYEVKNKKCELISMSKLFELPGYSSGTFIKYEKYEEFIKEVNKSFKWK